MAVLDKKICEALSFADEVVDAKKDDTIEAVVSVKKAINTLGPVQSVVVRMRRLGVLIWWRMLYTSNTYLDSSRFSGIGRS